MQNDFNKCFKELRHTDFLEFSIIEIVEDIKNKELLTEREQVYLDVFLPEGNCYNILKKAKVDDKSCFSKTPEETRMKKSLSMKKLYENPEYKEKVLKMSLEVKQNKIKSLKKTWVNKLTVLRGILVSPNSEEFEIYNIADFAEKHELARKSISHLVNGRIKSCKGWTLKK